MNEPTIRNFGLLGDGTSLPTYDEGREQELEKLRKAQIELIIPSTTIRTPSLMRLGAEIREHHYLEGLIRYARNHRISLAPESWKTIIEAAIARSVIESVYRKRPRGGQKKLRGGLILGHYAPKLLEEVTALRSSFESTGNKATDERAIKAIVLRDSFRGENIEDLDEIETEKFERDVASKRVTLSRQRKNAGKSIAKSGKQRKPHRKN